MAKKYLQLKQGICFWCDGPTNELRVFELEDYLLPDGNDSILGNELFDYTPCKLCATAREGLTIVIEIDTIPLNEGQPEIKQGWFPTGRYLPIPREDALSIIGIDTDIYTVSVSIFSTLIGG